ALGHGLDHDCRQVVADQVGARVVAQSGTDRDTDRDCNHRPCLIVTCTTGARIARFTRAAAVEQTTAALARAGERAAAAALLRRVGRRTALRSASRRRASAAAPTSPVARSG